MQKRPIILKNNIFLNNKASYGPNIASYPIRIYNTEKEFTILRVDGKSFSSKIPLVDYDGQYCLNYIGYFINFLIFFCVVFDFVFYFI